MAFTPIVGSVAEVTMKGSMAAAGSSVKNVVSVFHYRLAIIVLPATKTALETAFNAGLGAALVAAYNVRYTQSENRVRYVDDAIDADQVFARAGVGAIATDSLPTLQAVSMLLRTGKRGRSFKGAKHFPASSEADTTGDVLTGAGLARWQTVQTAVFATIVDALGNSWIPSVLSRTLSTLATNPTTVIANDITQVLLNKNVGTMRRRRVATVR